MNEVFNKIKLIVIVASLGALSGCTTIEVRPVDTSVEIKHVCIRQNDKVQVRDFLNVLRDGFSRHGISSKVIPAQEEAQGRYIVTYTALRSWDLTPYLSHAEIRIEKDGKQIAFGQFHLKGKGGFALTKFKGTKSKMDPVIDQLLQGISTQ